MTTPPAGPGRARQAIVTAEPDRTVAVTGAAPVAALDPSLPARAAGACA
ncbi:hypothetical protein AB0M46_45430 [Dactylosporangium sp. NPDC051485]